MQNHMLFDNKFLIFWKGFFKNVFYQICGIIRRELIAIVVQFKDYFYQVAVALSKVFGLNEIHI